MAASLTLLLGSSFLMPCTMAVRISLEALARIFGSYKNTRDVHTIAYRAKPRARAGESLGLGLGKA